MIDTMQQEATVASRHGPVTIVTIDRAAVRNALDARSAARLRKAFAASDAVLEEHAVAVSRNLSGVDGCGSTEVRA